MKQWDVIAGKQIGPLVLGMTELELEAAWAAIPRDARSSTAMIGDDATPPATVLVQYDESGRSTRITVLLDQPVPVMLDGTDIRSGEEDAIDEVFRRLGTLEGSYGSAGVPTAGIGATKWERGDSHYICIDVHAPAS